MPVAKIVPPIVIGFAIVVALMLLLWRRHRGERSFLTEKLMQTEFAGPHSIPMPQCSLSSLVWSCCSSLVMQYRKAWEISHQEISILDKLGEGAVGEVFRVQWRDMVVAMKLVKGEWLSTDEAHQDLDREASMLQAVRHPHIVQFFGAGSLENGMPFILTELMELGTLSSVLRTQALDWDTKIRFARETALGMGLVHSLQRMHRDLKSGNILVTAIGGTMHVKVADFGTATLANMTTLLVFTASDNPDAYDGNELDHLDSDDCLQSLRAATMFTRGIGTPLWMAPEILQGRPYGPPADVYSFGIVLWELASQCEPWATLVGSGMRFMTALRGEVLAGRRPAIEAAWPDAYCRIMCACWAAAPTSRPSFAGACAMLNDLLKVT